MDIGDGILTEDNDTIVKSILVLLIPASTGDNYIIII